MIPPSVQEKSLPLCNPVEHMSTNEKEKETLASLVTKLHLLGKRLQDFQCVSTMPHKQMSVRNGMGARNLRSQKHKRIYNDLSILFDPGNFTEDHMAVLVEKPLSK